jgi:hypothetical protein
MTLGISIKCHYTKCCDAVSYFIPSYAECCYAEWSTLFSVMLNVIMLNVIMLIVAMLSVSMLIVVMMSAMAPFFPNQW